MQAFVALFTPSSPAVAEAGTAGAAAAAAATRARALPVDVMCEMMELVYTVSAETQEALRRYCCAHGLRAQEELVDAGEWTRPL